MANPYTDLPGAPPLTDTSAWAEHQGTPGGLVADDTPFTPVALPDLEKLSSAARHEFRQAVHAGDRASYEAWAAKHGQPNVAGSGAAGPGGSPVPPPDDAEGASSTPDPAAAEVDPARAALAERLEAHGSHIDAYTALEEPLARFHARLEALDDGHQEEALRQGAQTILARHYRGSEAAMRAGMAEIEQAAKAVGIDPHESGALADPDLHWRILLMAKTINGHVKPA